MDATDLAYAGIAKQAELIAAGEVSSRELVDVYLERIERFDPSLERLQGRVRGARADGGRPGRRARRAGSWPAERPLLGVPIAVKDEFDVAGEVSTFGTNAYGEPAKADSEIVRRMRAAGAIVIGKTHMPELGAFPWTESPTWGVTRNPWELGHSPGRLQRRQRGGGRRRPRGRRAGGRRRRIDPLSVGLLRPVRAEDPARARAARAAPGRLARRWSSTACWRARCATARCSTTRSPMGRRTPARRSCRRARSWRRSGRPGPLKIALATKLPPSPLTKLHAENRAALEQTAALLREPRPRGATSARSTTARSRPRRSSRSIYLRSVHEEAATFAHPERLERRIRALARIGGMLPQGALDWALGRKEQYAARLNEPLADHDVLLTPVTPAPAAEDRRPARAKAGCGRRSRRRRRSRTRRAGTTPASPPARCRRASTPTACRARCS